MDANALDPWTVIVSEFSAASIGKLSKLIDFDDPPEFFEFVCKQWELHNAGTPGAWNLLMDGQGLLCVVGHPSALTLKQAIALTGFAMHADPLFDTKLLRRLLAHRLWPEEVPADEAMRTLEILERLDDPHRLSMTLLKFSKFPDLRVQSKVAKILGHCIDSVEVMEELFQNRDGRVRANLLEGLGRRDFLDPYLSLIERATQDQHTRVSSIALAIRARLGHGGAGALIKMRSKSRMDDIRKSAEFAHRIASGKSSGRDFNGEEITGPEAGSAPPVDAICVIDPQPAVAAPVDEVHRQT